MDLVQRAKRVVDIATGQTEAPRRPPAPWRSLSQQRSEIARKAANARWQKHDAA